MLPETDIECDAPAARVPVHTTCPVEACVAITQHRAEASTTTVYGEDGATYVAPYAVGVDGASRFDAAVVVGEL